MHKWYVVQVLSGKERKVKRNIEEKTEATGMSEFVGEVIIPTERISEVKMGKQKFNEHGELIEVNESHKKAGITYVKGRRLLHGLNSEQMDEMNELGLGLDRYKELKGISDKSK